MATVGDVTYTLSLHRVDYDKPFNYSIVAKRGEQTVWGPVGLTLQSCRELLNDEDCTENYK